MNNNSGRKQARVVYAGRVQGVGFRMTVEETACRLGVVGWVKNRRDGRVELVAEAQEPVLRRFLEALRMGPMKNFIHHEDVSFGEATGGFREFEIRYW
jgi:acylphosphatase